MNSDQAFEQLLRKTKKKEIRNRLPPGARSTRKMKRIHLFRQNFVPVSGENDLNIQIEILKRIKKLKKKQEDVHIFVIPSIRSHGVSVVFKDSDVSEKFVREECENGSELLSYTNNKVNDNSYLSTFLYDDNKLMESIKKTDEKEYHITGKKRKRQEYEKEQNQQKQQEPEKKKRKKSQNNKNEVKKLDDDDDDDDPFINLKNSKLFKDILEKRIFCCFINCFKFSKEKRKKKLKNFYQGFVECYTHYTHKIDQLFSPFPKKYDLLIGDDVAWLQHGIQLIQKNNYNNNIVKLEIQPKIYEWYNDLKHNLKTIQESFQYFSPVREQIIDDILSLLKEFHLEYESILRRENLYLF